SDQSQSKKPGAGECRQAAAWGLVWSSLVTSCLSGCFSSPQSVGVRLVKSTAKHTTRSAFLKQPDKHESPSDARRSGFRTGVQLARGFFEIPEQGRTKPAF